jgi:transcriptional regulator with XRE-family HTH domain
VDTKTQRRAFGRRLRAKRAARGLSLSEFARRADVAKPTAWGWEHGDYSPSMGSLRRITTVLDCTVDDLIEAA